MTGTGPWGPRRLVRVGAMALAAVFYVALLLQLADAGFAAGLQTALRDTREVPRLVNFGQDSPVRQHKALSGPMVQQGLGNDVASGVVVINPAPPGLGTDPQPAPQPSPTDSPSPSPSPTDIPSAIPSPTDIPSPLPSPINLLPPLPILPLPLP